MYKLEFENDQVRVSRVKFAAHQQVPEHQHMLNRAVVYLTDQHSKITAADGKVDDSQHKAGQVSWGVPAKHHEENLLDISTEAIMVEIKN